MQIHLGRARMQIPTLTTTITSRMKATPEPQRMGSTLFEPARLREAPAMDRPQANAPGMSEGQFDSMLQNSLKMRSIRNDSTIPEEVKGKLLEPLNKANQQIVVMADAKAEQAQKSEIVEAAITAVETTFEMAKEIAESSEAESEPSAPTSVSPSPGTHARTLEFEAAGPVNPATLIEMAGKPNPLYAASDHESAIGRSIDIQA